MTEANSIDQSNPQSIQGAAMSEQLGVVIARVGVLTEHMESQDEAIVNMASYIEQLEQANADLAGACAYLADAVSMSQITDSKRIACLLKANALISGHIPNDVELDDVKQA